ncbi:MAG TPA: hypothetical protein VFC93_21445 [Chloroflexota bacterium]|nr:hypothetical protein [Chloroflexota bacterium]
MMLCPKCTVPTRIVNAADSRKLVYWCPACRSFYEKQRSAAGAPASTVKTV